MRLARCRNDWAEFWGVVDLSEGSIAPIDPPFSEWAPEVCRNAHALDGYTRAPRPFASVDVLAPLEPGSSVFAGGANYGRHLAELGLDGAKPTVFLKANSSLIGAHSEIRYPAITDCLDYEVELVAVFGAEVFDPDDPWAGVLGYAVGNDVSARDLQFAKSVTGMDIFSAKSLRGTSPVGPWVVTRDEIGGGKPSLTMTLTVNGELRQHASTGEMAWDVAGLLAYADSRAGVSCGDLLFTGSPAGIGHSTGRYLQPGDVVEAAIESLGAQRNIVGARPPGRAL
jgi:2-keto-4-pentenoate hydratase/2-oxohepta-3-ene-1,7-dioic acid hydratase in catechol pathway